MFKLWKRLKKQYKARRFYTQWISPGMFCFDIGANAGEKTDFFLHCGGRVLAVEPQQSCYASLVQKYSSDNRVQLVHKAVGDTPGEAELNICNIDEVSTLSAEFRDFYNRYDFLSFTRSEKVEVTTLDDLITRYGTPSFCKLDIEGYELPALLGLSHPIAAVEFEFNGPFKGNAVKCVERLNELGNYRFNYCTYENYRFELPRFERAEQFMEHFSSLPDSVLTGDIFAVHA